MPRKKRQWFQISLRTFLAVLTVFIFWLGFHANSARQQRIAVAALEQAGVKVTYDFQFDPNAGKIPDAKPLCPKWLIRTVGIDFFARVTAIECHEGDLDKVVKHCANLTDVTNCFLGGTKLSDSGLRHVAEMPSLERLGLEYTQVSDEGLKSLLNLRNLKAAFLMGTNSKVSEEMIEKLEAALPECEFVCDPRQRPTPE